MDSCALMWNNGDACSNRYPLRPPSLDEQTNDWLCSKYPSAKTQLSALSVAQLCLEMHLMEDVDGVNGDSCVYGAIMRDATLVR